MAPTAIHRQAWAREIAAAAGREKGQDGFDRFRSQPAAERLLPGRRLEDRRRVRKQARLAAVSTAP
jgi:hypothetical protein